MKARPAPQAAPEGPTRVEFRVRFTRRPGKGRRPTRIRPFEVDGKDGENEGSVAPVTDADHAADSPVDPAQVPRLTRLLVLGHHFERLVRDGVVRNYAEIALLTGLSRVRITQAVNLTLLAPRLQKSMLLRSPGRYGRYPMSEQRLRRVVRAILWSQQEAKLLDSPSN